MMILLFVDSTMFGLWSSRSSHLKILTHGIKLVGNNLLNELCESCWVFNCLNLWPLKLWIILITEHELGKIYKQIMNHEIYIMRFIWITIDLKCSRIFTVQVFYWFKEENFFTWSKNGSTKTRIFLLILEFIWTLKRYV